MVAPIDISALRHERSVRTGHHTLAHLRSEAYPVYGKTFYAPGRWTSESDVTVEHTKGAIADAKTRLP